MFSNWTAIPILNNPSTAEIRLEKTMKRSLMILFSCVLLAIAVTLFAAQTTVVKLGFPKPHYHAEKGDPTWLVEATQFHGHLGPAIVFGCRAGMVALDTVGAQGYFDVEVTVKGPFDKPPQSCVLDGLQLSTGATMGKHNLNVVVADEYVITVKNKRTSAAVEIRPTPETLKLLPSERLASGDAHEDMHRAEAIARQIVNMPQDKMMTVKKKP